MRRPVMARSFWVGVVSGALLVTGVGELRYVNWRRVVPPIEGLPLALRQDAKGSGAFQAPRSGGRRHTGIDLAAPLGTPVQAIRSGNVIQVGTHRGLGRFVELEHRQGLKSLYAHLAETDVAVGQRVRQGQRIGTVGKTGNARHPLIEPHVHLQVTRAGEPMDPAALGLAVVSLSAQGEATDGRGGD